MTNSLFEKGETKERKSFAERWMRLFCSLNRAEISPFPRSSGILGELLDYKDKGSRDVSGYSSPANSGWKRGGEVLLLIKTVKSDYRGFRLANTNINSRNL